MNNIVELSLTKEQMLEEFYPKIEKQVFHYTSGDNLNQILNENYIFPFKEGVQKTSAHSHESMGRFLNAVCLFDLRFESNENIEKIRGWYNFLAPRFEGTTLVYLVLSTEHYDSITTLSMTTEKEKSEAMYLPHIESWHKEPLALSKLEVIYKVNLINE